MSYQLTQSQLSKSLLRGSALIFLNSLSALTFVTKNKTALAKEFAKTNNLKTYVINSNMDFP